MMDRDEYAADHRKQLKAFIQEVGGACPKCGGVHGQTVRVSERTGNKWVVYLQLSHPDHDPWNPDARKEIMCNGCHMGKDGPLHAANAQKTRKLREQTGDRSQRYRRNSIPNRDILRIANTLGIELAFVPDEEGGCWYWTSEITSGSHRELSVAFSQALYDVVTTYRESEQAWREFFAPCLHPGAVSQSGRQESSVRR
jgi:hypothetical protein